MKHVLIQPIVFEEKEIKELEFDLGSVTGRQLSHLVGVVKKARNEQFLIPNADQEFGVKLCCVSAGLPHEVSDSLKAADWFALGNLALITLSGSD